MFLAVLVFEQLDALLAQNEASLARATAAIAQAKSQIVEAEAREKEAKAQLERARPLVRDKYLSESTFDTREAAAKAASAQLTVAENGLRAAEAEKAQVEANAASFSGSAATPKCAHRRKASSRAATPASAR